MDSHSNTATQLCSWSPIVLSEWGRDICVWELTGCAIMFVGFDIKAVCSYACVCVCVCVREREREREKHTHMVRRAMFSIKRFGDEHLSEHRVDIKHLIWWLICSHPSDAVPDGNVLVLVGTNLRHNRQRGTLNQSVNQSRVYSVSYCVSLSHMSSPLSILSWTEDTKLKHSYHGQPTPMGAACTVACLSFRDQFVIYSPRV